MCAWSRASKNVWNLQSCQWQKAQNKFHWSSEGLYSTLVKRWSNRLFWVVLMFSSRFSQHHTLVPCSCCCKHLAHTKREGPTGIPLMRPLSLSGHMYGLKWMESVVCILNPEVWRLQFSMTFPRGTSSIAADGRGSFYWTGRNKHFKAHNWRIF